MAFVVNVPAVPLARRTNPDRAPSGAERLVVDLLNEVRGEVRFDPGTRAAYSTDASNYRQVPIGVVLPRDTDDVVRTVEVCRAHGVPILSRGGGTSLAGQTCNVAVVMDHSKYNHDLLELDPEKRTARVRPGIVLDTLRDAAEQHHLTFGPDPATHDHCTLGGMIGNDSCGVHSVMAGKTDDNVEALEILTYDGVRMRVGKTSDEEYEGIVAQGGRRAEIYRRLREFRDRYADEIRARYPDIPRRVSGYDLPWLLPERGFDVAKALVGSESTLVTVLEATVRLVPSPPGRTLVAVGYQDVYAAADDVPAVMAAGPIACEGMDDALVHDIAARGIHPASLHLLPEGRGWLLVEFGGKDRAEADERAKAFAEDLRRRNPSARSRTYDDPADEAKLWKVRESGLGATAMVPGKPNTGPGWEDSAVRPDQLGDYLRDMRRLMDRFGYEADFYGHFGQGVLHCRIDFDLITADGIRHFRHFMDEAADTVLRYGGSLSGEHGDGQARAALLPKMFGDDLVRGFDEFKAIWDPDGRMNPGKVVHPNPITSDLRLGTDYDPPQPRTWFSFQQDGGSFAHAAFRCVGVGECRRHGGGTMCPSYMVTREEEHSTRGRSRLLFEMLNGSELQDGWRSDEVEEALDLCLACKGCKGDCPVNVDMATYKAEFRAHHYKGRLRPRAAYSMGLIHWWAALAARAPRLANLAAHAPGLSAIAKRIGGIAPERTIPRFAERSFRAGFANRPPRAIEPDAQPVMLWVDTFNERFHPEVLDAAVDVLEAAGCRVELSPEGLCCGRPLYDWGLLAQAKRLLRQVLRGTRGRIREGVPVVGLEPSCISVFRDELPDLLHDRPDARRLAGQAYLLTEFLEERVPGYRPPRIEGSALVHGHCHHKSVLRFAEEKGVLEATGLDLDIPDTGCCGMAGAFGFEAGDHYRVSVAAGERVLLPAVRAASEDTLIVTGGFSCREQIEQGTGRQVLHPAEVLARAIRAGAGKGEPAVADGSGRDRGPETGHHGHDGHEGDQRTAGPPQPSERSDAVESARRSHG